MFMFVGNQFRKFNLDLTVFTFSVYDMSAGLIVYGLILSGIGVMKLLIDIVLFPEERQFSPVEARVLIKRVYVSSKLSDRFIYFMKDQRGIFIGGLMLLIGLGFWETSNVDFNLIAKISFALGLVTTIFYGIQYLVYIIDLNLTIQDRERANNKVSYGLIAYSYSEVQEMTLTSPKRLAGSKTIRSLIEYSVSFLEKNSSKNATITNRSIPKIFSYKIAQKSCSVVYLRFKHQESIILFLFVIYPPWDNQADLTTFFWNEQIKSTSFFNFLDNLKNQIEDLITKMKETMEINEVQAANENCEQQHNFIRNLMEDFRTFFTKEIITIKQENETAFN